MIPSGKRVAQARFLRFFGAQTANSLAAVIYIMKISNPFLWMPRVGCGLLMTCCTVSMALAQGGSAGVVKFEQGAFPGYVVEDVVVPVPSEIFSVLDKLGDPNWRDEVRPLNSPDTSNRMEISLVFGTVVAEGFVAVQAQDKQAVEDIGREVINLAARLGLTKAVRPHAQSILDSVQKNDWKGVRKEFDQTQATVRSEMQRMQDNDLAQCVSLGGWLRGTASVTSVVGKNFSDDRAELLNQPMLVNHFSKSVEGMSSDTKNNRLVSAISKGLNSIQKEMDDANGKFSPQHVKDIRDTCEELLVLILKTKK